MATTNKDVLKERGSSVKRMKSSQNDIAKGDFIEAIIMNKMP